MRLHSISIDNFLGARSVHLPFASPAILLAAANGAGKSSVLEAARLALTGDTERLGLKKDIGQIISEGAKAGSIEVQWSSGDAAPCTDTYRLPSGERIGSEPHPALAYLLDTTRFAALKPAERRSLLFKLTGASISREAVAERLQRRGVRAEIVEAVLPMIRAGFPEACAEAKSKATEAKGAWRAITGETYGDKKADNWKATAAPFDQETYDLEASKAIDCDADLAEARDKLGRLKGQRDAAKHQQERVSSLRAQAKSYASKAEELKQAEATLKDADAAAQKAEAAHAELSGKVKPSTKRQAAAKVATDLACPHCEASVFLIDGKLLAQLPAPPEETAPASPEVQAQIDAARIAHVAAMSQVAIAKAQRDLLKTALAAADQAASTLRTLDAATGPVPSDEEITEAEALVQRLTDSATGLRTSMQEMQAAKRAHDAASSKTDQARRHHADVSAWSLCADALAPDGIPGEILAEALGPVTDALQDHAQASDWPAVTIDAEMVIRYGGRLLTLCSESERWRADAMIAATIAQLSGLRVLMLDRIDVLDLPGRSACIEWLDHLLASGELESALVAGTFKSLPSGLPDTITPVWLEKGRTSAPVRAAA